MAKSIKLNDETEVEKQQPYWFLLLDHWVNREQNSGLSLPFIIGSKHRYVTGGQPDDNAIELLFNEIMESSMPNHCVGLAYCNTIKAYILTIVPRQEIDGKCFFSKERRPTLALVDNVFGDDVDLEWIIGFLKNKYAEPISTGKYSRKNNAFGGWESFDEKDDEQIKSALNLI
ncbi:MAG: hypothetical protein EON51_02000 [Acinetobacter sp.]|nr:MAG: hypothetical protein EON51_02000 [Acinetobacter sp.]